MWYDCDFFFQRLISHVNLQFELGIVLISLHIYMCFHTYLYVCSMMSFQLGKACSKKVLVHLHLVYICRILFVCFCSSIERSTIM